MDAWEDAENEALGVGDIGDDKAQAEQMIMEVTKLE
jgi:hypothetical protein